MSRFEGFFLNKPIHGRFGLGNLDNLRNKFSGYAEKP